MTLQQDAPSEPVQVVPSRPTRGPNRTWRLLQVTHRWFSLITGIVLLAIILSGAILVLAPEIDECGSGYGYVPLVLPLLGLAWLSTRARPGLSGR